MPALRGLIAFNNDGGDSTPLALVIWGATGSPLDKVEATYPESWTVGQTTSPGREGGGGPQPSRRGVGLPIGPSTAILFTQFTE